MIVMGGAHLQPIVALIAGVLIARVKAVPSQPGFTEIRIPGEQSARNRQRLAHDGIDIDRLVYERLGALAG